MTLLVICGDHPRHRFLLDDVINSYEEKIVIIEMKRESLVPDSGFIKHDDLRNVFEVHFQERLRKEAQAFGTQSVRSAYNANENIIFNAIDPVQLNSKALKEFLKGHAPFKLAVTMGPLILDNEVLEIFPENHFNVHLGLSPWYRGSATLFWPTYNLEPWKCGVTLHKLNSETDAGNIFHQTGVELNEEDGCQDTAIRAIQNSRTGITDLFNEMRTSKVISTLEQPFYGRTYLSSQIRPEHLWEIYRKRGNQTIKMLRELEIEPRNFKLYSILK